jgi:pilus assembly protein CpaB
VNRKKMTGLIVSLLAATIGVFAILKYSSAKQAAAPVAAAEPQVAVLKVTKQIPKGTPASQLADYVTQVQIPSSALQPDTASSLQDLANLSTTVTNIDLLVGEQLSKQRLSAPEKLTSSDIVDATNGTGATGDFNDLVGVWVSLSPLNALNGNLKPGVTRVAVFAAFEPIAGIAQDVTKDVPSNHLLVHKAPVLDVYPPIGAPVPAGQPATPLPPAIQVKLGLSPADAERVIFAQLKGLLYLGEENLSVNEGVTKIVERGNIYDATAKGAASAPKPVLAGAPTTLPAGTKAAPVLVGAANTAANATATTVAGATTPVGGATPSTVAAPVTPVVAPPSIVPIGAKPVTPATPVAPIATVAP